MGVQTCWISNMMLLVHRASTQMCTMLSHIRETRRLHIILHHFKPGSPNFARVNRKGWKCPHFCERVIRFGSIVERSEFSALLQRQNRRGSPHASRRSYSVKRIPKVSVLPGFWLHNTGAVKSSWRNKYKAPPRLRQRPVNMAKRALWVSFARSAENCCNSETEKRKNALHEQFMKNNSWIRPRSAELGSSGKVGMGVSSPTIFSRSPSEVCNLLWVNQVRNFSTTPYVTARANHYRTYESFHHHRPPRPANHSRHPRLSHQWQARGMANYNHASTSASSFCVWPEPEIAPVDPAPSLNPPHATFANTTHAHGAFVDFDLAPQFSVGSPDLTEDVVNCIEQDLERYFATIRNIIADIRRVADLGELPVSVVRNGSTIRVSFPNSDSEQVETLLRDIDVSRGRILDAHVSMLEDENQSRESLNPSTSSGSSSSSRASTSTSTMHDSSDFTPSTNSIFTNSLWSSVLGDNVSDMSTPALTLSGSTPSTTASRSSYLY